MISNRKNHIGKIRQMISQYLVLTIYTLSNQWPDLSLADWVW